MAPRTKSMRCSLIGQEPHSGTLAGGFFRVSISLPATLESFVETRAGQMKYAGSVSAYIRDLVLADRAHRVRVFKPQPGLPVFRTTISLPSELAEFVNARAVKHGAAANANASAYFRALVLADQEQFVKLPPKQRAGWISPKVKVAA